MNHDEKEKKNKTCEGVREVNERHEPLQLWLGLYLHSQQQVMDQLCF